MLKVKWDFLVPDSYGSLYEEHGFRLLFAFMGGIIPNALGIGLIADGVLAAGIPILFVGLMIFVGWGCLGFLWPKLHYLYRLNSSQKIAVEWYENLSVDERKQLPDGWDKLVRESNTESYYDYDYRYTSTASKLYAEAQEVISLYQEANKQPSIPDYRIETYLQLMRERKEDLQMQIKQQKETEKQIALMD